MFSVSVSEYIFMLVLPLACFFIGYICGKFNERVEWNKLIREGKIPRPQ